MSLSVTMTTNKLFVYDVLIPERWNTDVLQLFLSTWVQANIRDNLINDGWGA